MDDIFEGTEEVREDGDGDAENLVFHYDRERRIQKAPSLVKDYYAGKFGAWRPGLFKALVSTRGNRFMMFALVLCLAIVLFNSFFNRKNETVLHGIPVSVEAFSFDDTVYISVLLEEAGKNYTQSGAVRIHAEVRSVNSDGQISDAEIFDELYYGDRLYIRTTFPDYDIISVEAEVTSSDESAVLSVPVKKR